MSSLCLALVSFGTYQVLSVQASCYFFCGRKNTGNFLFVFCFCFSTTAYKSYDESGWSLSQNEILEDTEREAMMCSLASVLHFGWGQEVKRFGLTGKGTE